MSLTEIRSLLEIDFSTRETLSILRLLLAQLAACQRVDDQRSTSALPPASSPVSLAFVVKVFQSMHSQQSRILQEVPPSAEKEVEMHQDDSLAALCDILASLSRKYCSTKESDEGRRVYLPDLTSEEAVRLLCALFSSSRVVERQLAARLTHIEAAVNNLVTKSKGYRPLTTEFDLEVIQSAPVHCVRKLNASFLSMSSHKASLLRVLHTKSLLTIIDVSYCLMGDELFTGDVMKAVRWMQHLRVLLLAGNNLTDVSGLALIDALQWNASAQEVHHGAVVETAPFVSLVVLSLEHNELSAALEQSIDETLAARSITQTVANEMMPQKGESRIHLLHCEGVAMHASFLAMSLRRFATDAEYQAFRQKADIFSGVSFSTIVAVAMAASIDPERIWACFTRLAARVFVQYDKGFYAVAATRAARSWWTKGNFYNQGELRDALVELLGAETCAMTLQRFAAHFGKHVILFARVAADQNDITATIAFRSWKPSRAADILVPLGPEDATLLEILLACCSLEHFFAPTVVGGTAYVDAVTAPIDSVAVELVGVSPVACRILCVVDSAPSGRLVYPSVQAKIATTLRRSAEQRAVGSMKPSEWTNAQSAMVLWSELFLSIAISTLKRMRNWSRLVSLSSFALSGSNALRRNAVRLDDDRLDVAIESIADLIVAPSWS